MHSKYAHEALDAYPVVTAVTVEWGDQDILAHVNNTVFLKWCETARVIYLEKIGMWELIKVEGKGPIVVALSCDYRQPVTFPDTIHVGARVTKIGRTSFHMEHVLVSAAQNAVVAEARSTLVFLEYSKSKPLPVPLPIRDAMEQLEGRPILD